MKLKKLFLLPGYIYDCVNDSPCEASRNSFVDHGWFQVQAYPEDPSVLKIVRRVNSAQAVKFGTEMRKRYGDCSEMLVFLGKRSKETVRIIKNYGPSEILRIPALY